MDGSAPVNSIGSALDDQYVARIEEELKKRK
jgi:hypothetical protein